MIELIRERYLKQIRPFYHDDGMIKVLIGIRRCGKSFIMRQISDELQSDGVSVNTITYIDLDDPMNYDVKTPEKLNDLIKASIPDFSKRNYLFIDEIQNVKGFEDIVNGYRNIGVSVFITGSNSYLLSTDLTTKLTGRYIEFKILPFSFAEVEEYYRINRLPVDKENDFRDYLIYGGLPKRFDYQEKQIQEKYIDSVLSESINKDILLKNRVRDRILLEDVIRFISSIPSGEISSTSITDYLRKESIRTKPATVKKYLDMVFASSIASKCQRYDVVGKKALKTLYKSYLTDMAIHTMHSGKRDRLDYGMLIENIVYNELISKGYKVFTGKKGPYEIDFVVFDGMKKAYIQVSFSMIDDSVRLREEKPLIQISDNYPKYIVTMDHIFIEHDGIIILNLIDDFLLGDGFSL